LNHLRVLLEKSLGFLAATTSRSLRPLDVVVKPPVNPRARRKSGEKPVKNPWKNLVPEAAPREERGRSYRIGTAVSRYLWKNSITFFWHGSC
jgi:hypothetical protein